jgi:hypothetical protein
MDAGSLRDRIHIQRRLTGGGLGQLSNNWEEVAKVWANIRFASGSETVRAGQVASKLRPVSEFDGARTSRLTCVLSVQAWNTASRPFCQSGSAASMWIWCVR